MNRYFSTFITGFDQVIKKVLEDSIKDAQIGLLTDGLVIYATNSNLGKIKNLKFLNNSFILLRKFDHLSSNPARSIVKDLIKDRSLGKIIKKHYSGKKLKFRIRASVKNQFVSIDKNLLRNLEERIISAVPNLGVDRSLPDIEILISVRSEGFGLVGIQFSKRPNYEKTLAKGELYPELAYILCLISEPNKEDIFFDPFAGHGAIPAQRLNFPYKQIRVGEIDRGLQKKLEKRFSKKVIVDPVDALSLSTVADESIDKIVTDPPWGLYDTDKDIPKFYTLMLKQFTRVLKPTGIMVILTAQKEVLKQLLGNYKNQLKLEEEYSTLVSGKKAGVYKLERLD
jgi:tRNA (guanine6-N2)-methyltransferase